MDLYVIQRVHLICFYKEYVGKGNFVNDCFFKELCVTVVTVSALKILII